MPRDHFLIAQIGDIHCGSNRYDEDMLDAVIAEVNDTEPDLILCPGDLTDKGYPEEFRAAKAHLDRFKAPMLVVPGNHDARNVGYAVYESIVGQRNWAESFDMPVGAGNRARLKVVGCDSTRPDLNDGELGRHRQEYVADEFEGCEDAFKILMIHHHLVSIPGTGRERNILLDAGDVLQVAVDRGIDVVLAGHKHVPNVWPIAGVLAITSGTASTWRTRGFTPPSYNWIRIFDDHIEVTIQDSTSVGRNDLSFPRRLDA